MEECEQCAHRDKSIDEAPCDECYGYDAPGASEFDDRKQALDDFLGMEEAADGLDVSNLYYPEDDCDEEK